MRLDKTARLLTAGIALATLAVLAPTSSSPASAAEPFRWTEATIAQVHSALLDGRVTCREVVIGYLARIAAYDRQGPSFNSIIAVDPSAVAQADALDADQARTGTLAGRLHCVPVAVKDNIQVQGLPTTAGSAALAGARPPGEAFVVQRLRSEGAVVLAKANLDEFAFGFGGASEVGGQVHNAYDVTRGPGGSSSGSGASVAASLALTALGTDTGGSVRVPASVEGLVGIRPSMRLLSQRGIVPLALFQDTAGPICRVVQDCATMLDALVGHDPSSSSGQYTSPQQRDDTGVLLPDPATYTATTGGVAGRYSAAVAPTGLQGARLGVVRALFGTDPAVVGTLDAAITRMRAAGATVDEVTVPDLSTITSPYSSLSAFEFKDQLTRYLQSWSSDEDKHPRTFEAVQARAASATASTFAAYAVSGNNRYSNPAYVKNTVERPAYVRPRLLAALDNTTLSGQSLGSPYDALLYPSVQSLPRVGAAPASGNNNRLSPFSGFPALSMPAGYTAATSTATTATGTATTVPPLPVGMELLGREFAEATLVRLASGYQSVVAGTPQGRQAPTTVAELPTSVRRQVVVTADRSVVAPGQPSHVLVSGPPGTAVELLAYSRPSTTYVVVRRGTLGDEGSIGFDVRPGTNTRLRARTSGVAASESPSVVVSVAATPSLSVTRTGPRTYAFSGRVMPARAGQGVALYRLDTAGRETRTAVATTDASGTWRVTRRFTWTGTFGFLARTGTSLTNVAGSSGVRLATVR
ncbi:MAG: hypothetical protein JWM64_2744 [Frankiales bacterium]|nr:hypothetical protein [Frankiales bacterium]